MAIRQTDWCRGRRLGPDERLVVWPKSRKQSAYLTAEEWAKLPAEITVRLIRVRVQQKGFRSRELAWVTTLLDTVAYPMAEIVAAYRRRWCLEMGLDDLKTTLGLDALRCQSPAMIHRELLTLLIAHNLIRSVMTAAARAHEVPLARISFTGTLVAVRRFGSACAQTTSAARRRLLWQEMLRIIAADTVPFRPDRWEPRALNRRPKAYPLLTRHRHTYAEIRHGSHYRRQSET